MLPKRFHDDNEPIVAPKRFHIYKNGENIEKCWSMDLEWNGTGGFWKRRSRESIGVWKDVRRLWEMLEMSECGIGKRQSMENFGNVRNVRVWNRKTSETLECEIGMEI